MTATRSAEPGEAARVSPYYIPATEGAPTLPARVLKHGDAFAVFDEFGNIQATGPSAEGLFFEDTRYLSQLAVTIDGARPLLLSSTISEHNSFLDADLTNPDLVADGKLRLGKGAIHILSNLVLGEDALMVTLELKNFDREPVRFHLDLRFAADFVDIFELRGTERPRRGRRSPDEIDADGAALTYRGLDEVNRRTTLGFDPPPTAAAVGRASWTVELAPAQRRVITITIRCEREGRAPSGASRERALAHIARQRAERKARAAHLHSSNALFNDWTNRSRADLDMLISETPHGLYPYAGIPWFSTAFGRDGLITALECLWLDPTLAAGTLRYLAARQATAFDRKADAEPGKILHETRKGEMAALGEVPFACYYGSVDSTPLFVMLAAAYHARTGDLPLIRELWPNIEAALAWMIEYGDPDRDGFLEYDRKSVDGLNNQGWKDSGDSIFHEDGALAEAPIALAEVQAYAYGAYHGAAELATQLGLPARAGELARRAQELRTRFEASFWLEELGTYALALDRAKRPCKVRSSNAGHVLLTGLAAPERAARVAETLMTQKANSRWGIRTIAEGEARYNPMSYHNGSIWPHDNAVIGLGFGRYGLKRPLLQLLTGLFDASLFLEMKRLPELFCGFERRPGIGATAYPVACLPQAWSSAAVFALLGATLGITFDASACAIRFTRPALPSWLDELRLTNLRLGDAAIDLLLQRSQEDVAVHVLRREGSIAVSLMM